MLKAVNLTKIDDLVAVDHINAEIKSGSVFGHYRNQRSRKIYVSASGSRDP